MSVAVTAPATPAARFGTEGGRQAEPANANETAGLSKFMSRSAQSMPLLGQASGWGRRACERARDGLGAGGVGGH